MAVNEHVREARARGDMTQREAQDAGLKIALKVESAYHSGYEKPLQLKGARLVVVCLSYLGGWRSPIGEVMDTVGHTAAGGGCGDGERDVQMGRERSEESTA